MLEDLGKVKEVNILNSSDVLIDPATDDKLDELKNLLTDIEYNTAHLEITADSIDLNTDELEDKLDTIHEDLDTVEIKLQSIIDKNIAQETGGNLATVKTNTDKLDVNLSTRLSESDFNTRIGEVQDIPTQYTVLARLKDIWTKLEAGLTVIIAPDITNRTVQIVWDKSHTAIVNGQWQEILIYTVPLGYTLNCVAFEAITETANERARIVHTDIFGTFNGTTNTYTDSGIINIPPHFSSKLYVYLTTASGNSNDNLSITYVNNDGIPGRTGTVAVPKNSLIGTRIEIILQTGDIGILDVTNITHSALGNAGVYQIAGVQELFHLVMTAVNTQYSSSAVSLGGIVVSAGQSIALQYKASSLTSYIRRINLTGVLVATT